MILRVVNYAPVQGGVLRFMTELLAAMLEAHRDWEFEFISHGPALEIYGGSLRDRGLAVPVRDVRPRSFWRNLNPSRVLGLPGTGRLLKTFGFGKKIDYEVPSEIFEGCDAVWFPFIHTHRLPCAYDAVVLGSYHDTMPLEFKHWFSETGWDEVEKDLVRTNVEASIKLVASSQSTVDSVKRLFGVRAAESFHVIPWMATENPGLLSSQGRVPQQWEWSRRLFLLCAASFMPNKNHEGLFDGFTLWRRWPLVLTGVGMDLSPRAKGRSGALRDYALRKGLNVGLSDGCDVVPVGFVSDEVYLGLLDHAAALVMPSLAEGGSFPVAEAISRGVPVICSDIPVMREHLQRMGAEVLWFNPRDPADLARALTQLEGDYQRYKMRAVDQIAGLRPRSWSDIAADHWRLLTRSQVLENGNQNSRSHDGSLVVG
jgi:glycosyltransferase involved in cell wall biosynthesis